MSMVDTTPTERRIAERVDSSIANQIAVSDAAGGIDFRNAGELMEFAKMMAVSTAGVRVHLRNNPGACLAILTQALEWGLSPYAVANKSYFVNEQIAFESQLVQAVILKRAPIKGRIKFEFTGEGPDRTCKAWARLREDDEVVEYLSPKIKDIKPQNSPLWKNDPDQQLAYFSGRSLCRRHFPDVLLGIYDTDELVGSPAVGPDRARDVTPPKGISGKLDALAARPATTAPAAIVDHDPETGEVLGAEDDSHTDDTTPADPRREAVLEKLRGQVMTGDRRVAFLLTDLSGEERALVTDEDKNSLTTMQKGIEAERQKAGVQ